VEENFEFTEDYFSNNIPVWEQFLGSHLSDARTVMEIGCLEGRSTVWLLQHAFGASGEGTLHCLDSWGLNPEYPFPGMDVYEARFDRNLALARSLNPRCDVVKHKGLSRETMARLIAGGHAATFDFIYVDGSHRAQAVLTDLVLAFVLCRVGGVIACDDYLWAQDYPLLHRPKLAIDSFVNCYADKVTVMEGPPLYQVFLTKSST
jgi:predicted O-methyltransferase YrrM